MGTVAETNEGALARLEADVVQGVIVEVNPGSLGDSLAAMAHAAGGDVARVDLLELLKQNTTSEATKRTYEQGWSAFFGGSPRLGPLWKADRCSAVWAFCQWPRPQRQLEAYEFRARMEREKKSGATIENRQSAVRQVLRFAHTLGWCEDDGANLFPRKKVHKNTDLRGIGWEKAKLLLTLPAKIHEGDDNAARLLRLRDTAILGVMCQLALRNMSVRALDVGDWSFGDATLAVTEKGKGDSKRIFELFDPTNESIDAYTRAAGNRFDPSKPLFLSGHRGIKDGRISSNGLRWIVATYRDELGLARLYPHRLRHTAIARAAKLLKGDLLAIKDLSGHADIRTVEHYARQANSRQGEISKKLGADLKS